MDPKGESVVEADEQVLAQDLYTDYRDVLKSLRFFLHVDQRGPTSLQFLADDRPHFMHRIPFGQLRSDPSHFGEFVEFAGKALAQELTGPGGLIGR
jgi:hypothetical protein